MKQMTLLDYWCQFWYLSVRVHRTTMGGQQRTAIKWYPRVGFRSGIDHYGFADRRMFGVYWGPREEVNEAEIVYRHYVVLSWPRLFGLSWQ